LLGGADLSNDISLIYRCRHLWVKTTVWFFSAGNLIPELLNLDGYTNVAHFRC
jgi:hypothetical protein